VVELADGAGGFVRQVAQNYLPFRDDVVVPYVIARDSGLRDGTEIEGLARDGGNGRRVLVEVAQAGGMELAKYRALPHFQDLVSINPSEAFHPGRGPEVSPRVIDIIAPVAVLRARSPAAEGRQDDAAEHLQGDLAATRRVHLIRAVDERPEEVTPSGVVPAEVLASID
jgi:transcription termination factor Rho